MWANYLKEFGFGNFLNNDHTLVPGKVPDGNFYNKIYEGLDGVPQIVFH